MSYQSDLDEHIEKNLEEDVHHHGVITNPKTILSGREILKEYVDRLFEDAERENEK